MVSSDTVAYEIMVRDSGEAAAAAEWEEDESIPHEHEEKLLVSTILSHEKPKNTMFSIACHAWSYMTVQSRIHGSAYYRTLLIMLEKVVIPLYLIAVAP